ncbi:MAG: hypothetical protein AB2A00_11815 [Myxococcota bacterium]
MLKTVMRHVRTRLQETWPDPPAQLGALTYAAFRAGQDVSKAARQRLPQALGELAQGTLPPRGLVEEGMEGVRRTFRRARADAELLTAYRSYQRHEHLATSYRAQAILVLKLLEREAELALQAMPPARVAQLRVLAERIRDAGLATSRLTRGDAQCGQCERKLAPELRGGDCCSGMVFLAWDGLDAAFRVLLGERAPLVTQFSGDETRCGFLGPTGCLLTEGARPTVCTNFYCAPYRADLEQQGRWEALAAQLTELNAGRRALGFKVNMVRRAQGTHEAAHVGQHPLDFIWERLRQRGAERQASERNSPRLKVL